MKKIFSLILSFAMLATMLVAVPVAQASTIDDVPFIPMNLPFNADVIGKTGQIVGDNWAYGVTDAKARFGLSGDDDKVLAKNISDNTISVNKGGHDADKGEVVEGDTYYKFKINSSSLSVGESDALAVSTTAATINASGRPIEKIALLKYAFLNPGGQPVDYTVNYTDDTSETITAKEYWNDSQLEYVEWYGTVADGIDWNRDSQYLLPNVTTGALEAYTKTTTNYDSTYGVATGGMKGYQILYLPVDKTKTVKNVTLNAQYGNVRVFFLAATEIPLATADLQAQLTKVSALTTNTVDGDDEADVDLAKRYADELALRGYDVTSEMAHIAELQNALAWYDNESVDVPFIPVDLPFNADVIGKAGETPGANWANNAFMTGLGISGTCGIWNNISDDTIEFNEGGWDGVKLLPEGETAIPGDTGNLTNAKNNGYNIYKVRITSESLSAGVDDALVLSGTAATIPMSGRVVDRIMFMRMKMRYTQGSDTLRFKVNYADGTTETTDFVMGCSGHSSYTVDTIPYSEWYGNSGAQFRTGTGSDYTVITDASTGKLRALASTDCTQYGWPPSGNMKGFEMIYLPVDSSKEVESVELGTTAASNGNYIFAATEIPLATADLEAGVAAVDDIEPAQAVAYKDEILLAYRYAKELEARYISKVSTHVQELYDTLMATELGITEVTANKTDDGVEVAVDYTNETTLTANAVIIVAFYTNDGKVLVDVKSAEKGFATGTSTVTETFNTDKTWTSAKTFVLTDFDSLIPLTVATPVTQ